ncbi:MAG: hypothetical protein NTV14_00420, partial [Coprothermobacterota bacterium]|nr:hypothetical protein [Coprothermobacterota bacterium]
MVLSQTEWVRQSEGKQGLWDHQGRRQQVNFAAAYQPAAVSSLQQSPLEQIEAELKEKAQDSAARKTQLQQRIEVCWNAGDGACVFAGS